MNRDQHGPQRLHPPGREVVSAALDIDPELWRRGRTALNLIAHALSIAGRQAGEKQS